MGRVFKKGMNHLPLLPKIDWTLAEQLETLLTPYAADGGRLLLQAEGADVLADAATIAELREQIAEHEGELHTLRVNVNSRDRDGSFRLLEVVIRTPDSFAPGGLLQTGEKEVLNHVQAEAVTLFKKAAERAGGPAQPRQIPTADAAGAAWVIRIPKPNWWAAYGDGVKIKVVVGVVVALIVAAIIGLVGLIWGFAPLG